MNSYRGVVRANNHNTRGSGHGGVDRLTNHKQSAITPAETGGVGRLTNHTEHCYKPATGSSPCA